jgi:hypothetical protein
VRAQPAANCCTRSTNQGLDCFFIFLVKNPIAFHCSA